MVLPPETRIEAIDTTVSSPLTLLKEDNPNPKLGGKPFSRRPQTEGAQNLGQTTE